MILPTVRFFPCWHFVLMSSPELRFYHLLFPVLALPIYLLGNGLYLIFPYPPHSFICHSLQMDFFHVLYSILKKEFEMNSTYDTTEPWIIDDWNPSAVVFSLGFSKKDIHAKKSCWRDDHSCQFTLAIKHDDPRITKCVNLLCFSLSPYFRQDVAMCDKRVTEDPPS